MAAVPVFECAAVATSQMSNETLRFGEIDWLRQRTSLRQRQRCWWDAGIPGVAEGAKNDGSA